jgi:hypothetical protein
MDASCRGINLACRAPPRQGQVLVVDRDRDREVEFTNIMNKQTNNKQSKAKQVGTTQMEQKKYLNSKKRPLPPASNNRPPTPQGKGVASLSYCYL